MAAQTQLESDVVSLNEGADVLSLSDAIHITTRKVRTDTITLFDAVGGVWEEFDPLLDLYEPVTEGLVDI